MKKIFFLLSVFSLFIFSFQAFAAQKIEDVFTDIKKDYIYYNELQTLYDKGVITPDLNGKFNPNKLLSRDEFIGIAMEVGCSKCIKPYTSMEYILKYTNQKTFYDVDEKNDYGYCIADAYVNDVVKGYSAGYTCQDGTTQSGQTPFCTNNNITLEEAVAFLLRNSSVFTIADNQNVISQIQAGLVTQKLANDVNITNTDGSVYTFYGYFKKALDLDYFEYDLSGNQKKYSLVSVDSNGNINPKQYITKQDFLKMAYIISKINSCSLENNDTSLSQIGTQIGIFDKMCTVGQENCQKSNLDDATSTYDFKADTSQACKLGVKNVIWIFYNKNTKETFIEKGEYLDNYTLKSKGNWIIRLGVEDNCGNISSSESTIHNDNSNLSLQIQTNITPGSGSLEVDFTSITNCQNCTYSWDFGDGKNSQDKNPSHTFTNSGNYNVTLKITDPNNNTAQAKVSIYVGSSVKDKLDELEKEIGKNNIIDEIKDIINENENSTQIKDKLDELEKEIGKNNIIDEIKDTIENTSQQITDLSTVDTDGDGVMDNVDKCPTIPGSKDNSGCPVLDQVCLPNSEIDMCGTGFSCNAKGYCEAKKETNLSSACILPTSGSSIFGNVACNSCPCAYQFDFIATLRKCDVIIPAIVSPDGTKMYGKGNAYEIPYDYK
ncbi:MAG: PKD domain-containing protein [Candidatus Altimarinota bacterium]